MKQRIENMGAVNMMALEELTSATSGSANQVDPRSTACTRATAHASEADLISRQERRWSHSLNSSSAIMFTAPVSMRCFISR